MFRDHTKTVKVGDRVIGDGSPVLIQPMYNTETGDIDATVNQTHRLEQADYDIIRVAVPTIEAAKALSCIRREIHIPLVVDIHSDYRLATASIENGADKICINSGNIGDREKVEAVMDRAREYDIPVRVSVNNGSLEKSLLEEHGGVTVEGTVESALDKVRLTEDMGYGNLVISTRSSGVTMCIRTRELITSRTGYPLHVGITGSGTPSLGSIKSSVGLGIILYQGIGNVIRVPLTGDPAEEIKSTKLILHALGLRSGRIEVVSCPICGRTRIGLIELVDQVEAVVSELDDLDAKVTVMSCVVNGPGEARETDIGTADGVGEGLLIEKGEVTREVPETGLLPVLCSELESMRS